MRNSPSKNAGNFPPMNATPFRDLFWDWAADRYGPRRHAPEMLARDAGTVPRTARGWLRREHAPHAEHLVALMAECDDLAQKINDLVKERRACGSGAASSVNSAGLGLDMTHE